MLALHCKIFIVMPASILNVERESEDIWPVQEIAQNVSPPLTGTLAFRCGHIECMGQRVHTKISEYKVMKCQYKTPGPLQRNLFYQSPKASQTIKQIAEQGKSEVPTSSSLSLLHFTCNRLNHKVWGLCSHNQPLIVIPEMKPLPSYRVPTTGS